MGTQQRWSSDANALQTVSNHPSGERLDVHHDVWEFGHCEDDAIQAWSTFASVLVVSHPAQAAGSLQRLGSLLQFLE